MAVPQRISMITLGVDDVIRATTFYESLGWRRSPASQDTITFLRMEGSALALFGRDDLADDVGIGRAAGASEAEASGPGNSFGGVTLALNCDSRDEVDLVYAEWVGCGATPLKQPEAVFWGGYSSYVADPDGHIWEIAHNPMAPNGPDGRMELPAS